MLLGRLKKMSSDYYDLAYIGFHEMILVWRGEHDEQEQYRFLTDEEKRLVSDFNYQQREDRDAFLKNLTNA